MKKMADLQLTVVSDPRSKQAIEKQIAQWDENLEKLYIEQFRLRCYVSSLQGSELPNPKVESFFSLTTSFLKSCVRCLVSVKNKQSSCGRGIGSVTKPCLERSTNTRKFTAPPRIPLNWSSLSSQLRKSPVNLSSPFEFFFSTFRTC